MSNRGKRQSSRKKSKEKAVQAQARAAVQQEDGAKEQGTARHVEEEQNSDAAQPAAEEQIPGAAQPAAEEQNPDIPQSVGQMQGQEPSQPKERFSLTKLVRFLKAKMRMEGGKAFYVYSVLRILVIITAIRCLVTQNYENFALCLFSLVLFLLPSFFEETFKVEIPPLFEAIIYIFIFAAEILGEVNKYYTTIPGWDTLLHTLNGFLCAAIGFSVVDVLNRGRKIQLSPMTLCLVAFCFSMTVGVCWEFIEFTCDQLFYLDMQKDYIVTTIGSVTLDPTHSQTPFVISDIVRTVIETADGQTYTVEGGYLDIGIIDTMKDLFVNFVGALTFSIIGYFYEANQRKKQKDQDTSTFAQTSAKVVTGLKLRTLTDEQLEEEHDRINQQEEAIAREREERKQGREARRARPVTHT